MKQNRQLSGGCEGVTPGSLELRVGFGGQGCCGGGFPAAAGKKDTER